MLDEQDGYITINDKSSPELIYKYFGISKKAFKMAVGAPAEARKDHNRARRAFA